MGEEAGPLENLVLLLAIEIEGIQMGMMADNLAAMREDTKAKLPESPPATVPPPTTRAGSKKLLVSVDLDLHIRLKVLAAQRQMTLEGVCRDLLAHAAKTASD
jgi:hypothetical protein